MISERKQRFDFSIITIVFLIQISQFLLAQSFTLFQIHKARFRLSHFIL